LYANCSKGEIGSMKKEIEKKQKSNIGKKILFAIVLPLIFICMIMIIIFSFLGKNIFEEASNIPIIGSIFATDASVVTTEDLQKQINQLKAALSDEQAKVSDLEFQLEQKEQELETLKQENIESDLVNQEVNSENLEEQSITDEWATIAKTYENMKPKNAAAILVSMDEPTALNILSSMREKNVAAILEKMPAENAAKFTVKLVETQ
jgi:flagellar protein FlbB